jgi:hypothetical protein
MKLEYKGLFANVYYDDNDSSNAGWYGEYYDSEGTWGDSMKVWSGDMPTRRNASAKAQAVAMRALREEWRARRDRAKKIAAKDY